MKNKIQDLRNHLFEQMERLNNEDLTPEQLQREINRANAMSEIGKVIVDSAKTQVLAMKHIGNKKALPNITEDAEEFIDTPVVKLERPPAVYSNK
jgi:multidrug efflux pump subunit AcrB